MPGEGSLLSSSILTWSLSAAVPGALCQVFPALQSFRHIFGWTHTPSSFGLQPTTPLIIANKLVTKLPQLCLALAHRTSGFPREPNALVKAQSGRK